MRISNTVLFLACLALCGCGAYEQAQEAARQDAEKAAGQSGGAGDGETEVVTQATFDAMEVIARAWHALAQKNGRGPANVDELVTFLQQQGNTQQALDALKRSIESGRYTLVWNIDYNAWRDRKADTSRYRVGWHKNFHELRGGLVILASGGVINLTADKVGDYPLMTATPGDNVIRHQFADQQEQLEKSAVAQQEDAKQFAARARDNALAQAGNPGTPSGQTPVNPAPNPNTTPANTIEPAATTTEKPKTDPAPNLKPPAILTPQSSKQDFLASLKAGNVGQINQALSLLTAHPSPKPDDIVAKSTNPGLKFQAQQIIPTLQQRK